MCYDYFPEIYRFAQSRIIKHDLCDDRSNARLDPADIILHNHVLEHLRCDFRGVVCRLNERLKVKGIHVFSVPVRQGYFDEDYTNDMSGEERIKRFAQEDHMRIFGSRDIVSMMAAHEFKLFRLSNYITPGNAKIMGLSNSHASDTAGLATGNSIFFFEKK